MNDIDQSVFSPDVDANQYVYVICPEDAVPRVKAVLRAAAVRWYTTGGDGLEHGPDDEYWRRVADLDIPAGQGTDYLAGPKWVSDPETVSDGVYIALDCQGFVPQRLGDKLRQILVEELATSGLDGLRVIAKRPYE